MTQEEKQLLIKDLCARFPYGVMVHFEGWCPEKLSEVNLNKGVYNDLKGPTGMGDIPIPYLRPMSSMTEDEKKELGNFVAVEMFASQNKDPLFQLTRKALFADFFNKRHIDYRGLIPMGLALEAPEGMYKID